MKQKIIKYLIISTIFNLIISSNSNQYENTQNDIFNFHFDENDVLFPHDGKQKQDYEIINIDSGYLDTYLNKSNKLANYKKTLNIQHKQRDLDGSYGNYYDSMQSNEKSNNFHYTRNKVNETVYGNNYENILGYAARIPYYDVNKNSDLSNDDKFGYDFITRKYNSKFLDDNIIKTNFDVVSFKENRHTVDNDTNIQKIPKYYNPTIENKTVGSINQVMEMLVKGGIMNNIIDPARSASEMRALTNDYVDGEPNSYMNINDNTKKAVEERLLNLFTVIKFNNEECKVSHAFGSFSGTCYHVAECQNLGGKTLGPCAHAYGVCCVFQNSCGQHTSLQLSYFTNPGYPQPSTEKLTCSFTVEKSRPDIMQIRLDFEQFELKPPTNGTCVEDQFVVSGQNINNMVPIICGINNGQHIYLDVSNTNTPLFMSILTNSEEIRTFRIKVTQIDSTKCNKVNLNCLQYYTDVEGSLESFNYQNIGTSIRQSIPGYLNNLNYAICIRKEPGYCTITYTNIDNEYEYPFQLMNLDEGGGMLFPPSQAGAEIFNCPDDYIIINGIRMCGEKFNDGAMVADFRKSAPVTDYSAGPFILPIRTNQNVNGIGFKLFYKQNRCINNGK